MLDWAFSAGPLVPVGNLVLHLIYGFTLGQLYDASADEPALGDDLRLRRATRARWRSSTPKTSARRASSSALSSARSSASAGGRPAADAAERRLRRLGGGAGGRRHPGWRRGGRHRRLVRRATPDRARGAAELDDEPRSVPAQRAAVPDPAVPAPGHRGDHHDASATILLQFGKTEIEIGPITIGAAVLAAIVGHLSCIGVRRAVPGLADGSVAALEPRDRVPQGRALSPHPPRPAMNSLPLRALSRFARALSSRVGGNARAGSATPE